MIYPFLLCLKSVACKTTRVLEFRRYTMKGFGGYALPVKNRFFPCSTESWIALFWSSSPISLSTSPSATPVGGVYSCAISRWLNRPDDAGRPADLDWLSLLSFARRCLFGVGVGIGMELQSMSSANSSSSKQSMMDNVYLCTRTREARDVGLPKKIAESNGAASREPRAVLILIS